jgi:hypothetical protein
MSRDERADGSLNLGKYEKCGAAGGVFNDTKTGRVIDGAR